MVREQIVLQAGQCGNQVGLSFWKTLCREHNINPDGTDASLNNGINTGGGIQVHDPWMDRENTNYPQTDGAAARIKRLNNGSTGAFSEAVEKGRSLSHTRVPQDNNRSTRECKETFFYEADDRRYVPRSVMVDLEPRVLSTIFSGEYGGLFNRESSYLPASGGGAGNTWASGYSQGEAYRDTVMEIVNRESEGCDSMEGFFLLHSVAGGTGSGMGSYYLEQLADHFPKKLTSTCSVFPNQLESSDVVVQPYNTILALKRLTLHADCVFAMDNSALARIVTDQLRIIDPSFDQMNNLAASMLAAATHSLRFPTHSHTSMASLYASLIPNQLLHYLVSSMNPISTSPISNTPIVSNTPSSGNTPPPVIKTSALDVIRRLLHINNVTALIRPSGKYISALAILQSKEYLNDEANRTLKKVQMSMASEQSPLFIRHKPVSFQIHPKPPNKYSQHTQNKVSGFMLANHTGIVSLFEKTVHQYSKLRKAGAFLDQFKKEDLFSNGLDEFDSSRDVVLDLINEYKLIESNTLQPPIN